MLSPPKAAADILLVCLPLHAHVCVRVYVLSSRYISDRSSAILLSLSIGLPLCHFPRPWSSRGAAAAQAAEGSS